MYNIQHIIYCSIYFEKIVKVKTHFSQYQLVVDRLCYSVFVYEAYRKPSIVRNNERLIVLNNLLLFNAAVEYIY